MSLMNRFLEYAADFEKTLADDDWSRLNPYFTDDATYRVDSTVFGCELKGRDAIFRGMKKSLDGMDRVFPTRDVAVRGQPKIEGNEISMDWTVTYHKEGVSDFVLPGGSVVRYAGDKIELLVDHYDESVSTEAWSKETGIALDPSYV